MALIYLETTERANPNTLSPTGIGELRDVGYVPHTPRLLQLTYYVSHAI